MDPLGVPRLSSIAQPDRCGYPKSTIQKLWHTFYADYPSFVKRRGTSSEWVAPSTRRYQARRESRGVGRCDQPLLEKTGIEEIHVVVVIMIMQDTLGTRRFSGTVQTRYELAELRIADRVCVHAERLDADAAHWAFAVGRIRQLGIASHQELAPGEGR